jgi:hypothetical protein
MFPWLSITWPLFSCLGVACGLVFVFAMALGCLDGCTQFFFLKKKRGKGQGSGSAQEGKKKQEQQALAIQERERDSSSKRASAGLDAFCNSSAGIF